jgi:hypothetical protein
MSQKMVPCNNDCQLNNIYDELVFCKKLNKNMKEDKEKNLNEIDRLENGNKLINQI